MYTSLLAFLITFPGRKSRIGVKVFCQERMFWDFCRINEASVVNKSFLNAVNTIINYIYAMQL